MRAMVTDADMVAWQPPIDRRRGRLGMALFIASEATLFVMLFFAYFYLRSVATMWPIPKPELRPALAMLAVLVLSSLVLRFGHTRLQGGRQRIARMAILATVFLGAVFLALQAAEYRSRLHEITPATNAYGSIFYLITGIHGLHVMLGIAMLGWVAALPDMASADRPPHDAYELASWYWHFVDIVWMAIVVIIYVAPRVTP